MILDVPRGAKALVSVFELQLVRRWANEANVLVALVTRDLAVREICDEVGIPCFSSIGAAQKADWKWARPRDDGLSVPATLDGSPLRPKQPFLNRLGLSGFPLLLTLLLFAGATALLSVASILLIPSAHITIVPAALTVTDSREIILDPTVTTIDQINGILPITSFRREISGTASIATTKSNTAPADHASGQVVFTNLTGTPAEIPPGTIVETSSGITVRFSTVITSELPSGYNARVTVPIQATDPGPAGNVKPLQINVIEGPLSSLVRVINTAPTSGGTIKQVHVVTFNDKTVLSERLLEELHTAAISKLQSEAGSDYYVPPVSVQVAVLSQSYDHLVDDPADVLTLHIEAVAIGAGVDPADLQTFGQRALADKLPKGYTVLPGTLHVEPDVNARMEASSVILRLNSSEQATPDVDASQVLKGLNGKSTAEAEKTISSRVHLASSPDIVTNPGWWKFIPFFDFRIAFFVQTEAEARAH